MLKGQHLIAGQWTGGENTFSNEPISNAQDKFAAGTVALIDQAARAAEEAFWTFGWADTAKRAAFLCRIADEIDRRGSEITEQGVKETGLPAGRLEGERGRTVGQLKLFADHIEKGDHLDLRYDPALPHRTPMPRPDLHLIQRPIGPVAVFGASNFPLAFSTAGGDTAAALASGCPVVVRGHYAHPGVSDLVAQAIDAAIKACDMPPGVFSLIQGGGLEVGQALVQHPSIKAVGFTGSHRGGRALFDLCAARPEPIPFFGELGSVNPMFLLPNAVAAKGQDIATGWAASLTMGAGQFCTNPGVVVLVDGDEAPTFINATSQALRRVDPQTMLTSGIAASYETGSERLTANGLVQELLASTCGPRQAAPQLFQTTAQQWLANEALGEEVFGPLGLIVIAKNTNEMLAVAKSLKGQLTCTIHMDRGDNQLAGRLLPVLECKAGRVLVNGFPTGVEVCGSMVHGGPYPATTNFGATSVGTLSIRRFLRPVCYQNVPSDLLPVTLE
ncbi:aldehyde dehydrogenase (NADP(+)) [Ruegeria sp. SCPT10]|uniref:aldehyde dehydrogenase (NADP(+)) n=1 Tax=Ruegeria sp. SCP10 TaxID=3141377 RepID=UPI0033362FD5